MTDIQEIEKALKELIAQGDVPSRVTNRLLLAAIIQTRIQLELRIEALETKMSDNPSLILMFKKRPLIFVRTFLIILLLTSLVTAVAITGDDVIAIIISLLSGL